MATLTLLTLVVGQQSLPADPIAVVAVDLDIVDRLRLG
jgi:hypothetical protein